MENEGRGFFAPEPPFAFGAKLGGLFWVLTGPKKYDMNAP